MNFSYCKRAVNLQNNAHYKIWLRFLQFYLWICSIQLQYFSIEKMFLKQKWKSTSLQWIESRKTIKNLHFSLHIWCLSWPLESVIAWRIKAISNENENNTFTSAFQRCNIVVSEEAHFIFWSIYRNKSLDYTFSIKKRLIKKFCFA